jgi:YidC/Oxa1 family membrane protein insertase
VSNPFDIFLPVMVPFVRVLEEGLKWLAQVTGSGGLAIILFTIFLKLLLLPLSLVQTKSMKAMQAIQPEIAALKKKYPKDRERLAQEQMRLYKEHGVNPAAGCLPMIPMMIVLIGLYQALIHLSCTEETVSFTYCVLERGDPAFHGSWLWISNLGAPDLYMIGGIPIPGILPVLMLITQFGYGKLTPTTGSPDDPQQMMMMRMTTYFMPLMLFFFSFNFPAGLVLYWTISNIFEIIRMGVTVSWEPLRPENLFSGLFGPPVVAAKAATPSPMKRLAAQREDDVEDGAAAEPMNPPPSRPSGGTRKKKGKRSGKR